jgi:hypothetical protein
MRHPYSTVVALAMLLSTGLPTAAGAAPLAIDDFEDGTTMGWFVPGASPTPPVNVPDGGPTGAGDAFLQLQAIGGNQPGGRLSVLNNAQWTGDFIAEGIASIRMDVNNVGPDDVVLRLLFENFPMMGVTPTDVALTETGVFVPANSGWMTISFDLSLSNIISAGLGTNVGALSDVDVMRIFHNPDPTFPGPMAGIPPVTAVVGVDNIQAVSVPEPLTTTMLGLGVAAALLRARRRAS